MTTLGLGVWQLRAGVFHNLVTKEQVPYDSVPPVETPEFTLVASTSTDRSNPVPMPSTITAPLAVFVTPDTGIASVEFTIDGTLERVESNAPFDLKGATGDLANLWAPPARIEGYTVTAVVQPADLTVPPQTLTHVVTSTISTDTGGGGGSTPPPTDGPFPTADALAATGYRGTLRATGPLSTTAAGQTIESVDSGGINVYHSNTTIRNVKAVSGSKGFGINIASLDSFGRPITGILIEDSDIEMTSSSGGNGCIGGLNNKADETAHGDKITVRRCRLTGYADGIKVSDWGLYELNYIRVRRAPGTEKHVDGIQSSGHSHFTIRKNWIDQQYSGGHNSAIFWQPFTGAANVYITDIRVYQNIVNGGVYTIQSGAWKDQKNADGSLKYPFPGPGPAMTDCDVYDNVFYRGFLYGAFMVRGGTIGAGPGIRGGVWYDTREQVPVGNAN